MCTWLGDSAGSLNGSINRAIAPCYFISTHNNNKMQRTKKVGLTADFDFAVYIMSVSFVLHGIIIFLLHRWQRPKSNAFTSAIYETVDVANAIVNIVTTIETIKCAHICLIGTRNIHTRTEVFLFYVFCSCNSTPFDNNENTWHGTACKKKIRFISSCNKMQKKVKLWW